MERKKGALTFILIIFSVTSINSQIFRQLRWGDPPNKIDKEVYSTEKDDKWPWAYDSDEESILNYTKIDRYRLLDEKGPYSSRKATNLYFYKGKLTAVYIIFMDDNKNWGFPKGNSKYTDREKFTKFLFKKLKKKYGKTKYRDEGYYKWKTASSSIFLTSSKSYTSSYNYKEHNAKITLRYESLKIKKQMIIDAKKNLKKQDKINKEQIENMDL